MTLRRESYPSPQASPAPCSPAACAQPGSAQPGSSSSGSASSVRAPAPHIVVAAALALLLAGCGSGAAPATVAPAPVAPSSTASAPVAPTLRESPTCFAVEGLGPEQRALADSILASGLDNEALFTLAADPERGLPLKPMSSLTQRQVALARHPDTPSGAREATDPAHPELDSLRGLQEVVRSLECGPVRAVLLPFRATQDSTRSVQVVFIHQGRLDDVLSRDAAFWGQWGLVPGADPATVVTVVEYEDSGARFRGYGYLFGYPEHAVTFFTEAAAEMARTGDFVERDFFQIPVHSRESGRFVYAVPKGHEPLAEDLAIRAEAARVLEAYRARRSAFVNPDRTLRAVHLLRAWYAEGWHPSGP